MITKAIWSMGILAFWWFALVKDMWDVRKQEKQKEEEKKICLWIVPAQWPCQGMGPERQSDSGEVFW